MADAFQAIVARLDYPMFVATTRGADGEPAGCLVGFATQASIDPERFLVCVSDKNRTYRVLEGAPALALHVVPEDAHDVVELFGGETGDEVDKFERCEWHEGPGGVPVLDALPNRFVGRIVERVDAGDHDAMILEPVAAERPEPEAELTFHRAKRIEPGHAP
jgi:flavin reductase (DIM6/NTAB) family NADH-FMN oxidoreductase RutF